MAILIVPLVEDFHLHIAQSCRNKTKNYEKRSQEVVKGEAISTCIIWFLDLPYVPVTQHHVVVMGLGSVLPPGRDALTMLNILSNVASQLHF